MPTTDPELRDPSKGWVASLINWSIQNKLLVLIGAVALLVAGVRAVGIAANRGCARRVDVWLVLHLCRL